MLRGTISAAGAMLLATFVIGGMTFGARVESELYPVLNEIKAFNDGMQTSTLYFSGWMDKVRPECTPIDISFWMESAGRLIPLEANFEADTFAVSEELRTRPAGVQDYGPWTVSPYVAGEDLIMKTIHKCHTLWNTIGSYRIEVQ